MDYETASTNGNTLRSGIIGAAPQKESEINKEMNHLGYNSEAILKSLAVLENKLMPILRGEAELAEESNDKDLSPRTPIGDSLHLRNDELTRALQRVQSITRRLEI